MHEWLLQDVHVILRGGTSGPNYGSEHVHAAACSIEKARPANHPSIMIDCSRAYPRPPPSLLTLITLSSQTATPKRTTTTSQRSSLTSANSSERATAASLAS